MAKTFYISTPIYYPNAEPHLGHVYTTICADAVARYHRLKGEDTWFLTGTDEHGVKMVKTAQSQGTTAAELVEKNVPIFVELWQQMKISNDDFIRTTSDRHKAGVTAIVEKMLAQDDIYLGSYEGWYDEGQEEFVTETAAKDQQYKSAVSGRPLVRYGEPTYFFRLRKYADRVRQHIEQNPHFIQPEARRNEVLSKLQAGVEDLSISRASLKWGIQLPNDPEHVIYVWIDALSNYITALGYGQGEGNDALYRKYWPGVHLIGREILWFHTVYWPAMLMSIGQPLPLQVYAHGWWTAEGRKMSKSMGNFIDLDRLRAVINDFSLDALRYYLLSAAPFGNDLNWTEVDFNKSFNDLANVVGNCLNRVLKMVGKYCDGVLPPAGAAEEIDSNLQRQGGQLLGQVHSAYETIHLQQAVMLPIELARLTNGYIDATSPFKLAKDPAQHQRLQTVLNVSCQAIYRVLICLLPVLPEKAAEGLAQLGVQINGRTMDELFAQPLAAGHKLGSGSPLFPRVDPKKPA
ncbi:MAG: methionine--tRNA ligase [Phycisphaerales bacterium]|nr:methionine--tRNA ligase [Phycisphaerales bacterium]